MQRLVPSRLRVVQRDFLTRRGARRAGLRRGATSVEYTQEYISKYSDDYHKCPRLIDAESVHGDEHAYWTARRTFYRGRNSQSYYPTSDRISQVLIMLTRDVPRVPQEAAFRLFALGLKMMLLPRLVVGTELLLPSFMLMNAQNALHEAQDDCGKAKATEDKKTGVEKTSSESEATASTSTESAASPEGEKK